MKDAPDCAPTQRHRGRRPKHVRTLRVCGAVGLLAVAGVVAALALSSTTLGVASCVVLAVLCPVVLWAARADKRDLNRTIVNRLDALAMNYLTAPRRWAGTDLKLGRAYDLIAADLDQRMLGRPPRHLLTDPSCAVRQAALLHIQELVAADPSATVADLLEDIQDSPKRDDLPWDEVFALLVPREAL